MKKTILFVFAFFAFTLTNAQDVTVCGTDTLILEVDNYVNGAIRWEESIDNENWVSIEGAVGKTFTFFPIETKYYRAKVITAECDPLISATTLVLLPPKANAGSDREIGGNTTRLFGSSDLGAIGEWTIIAGEGGNIEESNNAYSKFTGQYGVVYSLVWTVANACTESSDTVSIVFEEIITKNNFIVVDNTDEILSNSTEMADGIYRIKFSDPTIEPFDSAVLIGMREDISFLAKVHSYILQDSVYIFTTEEGDLADIVESGPVNIGDVVNESMIEDEETKYDAFPTRASLKRYAGNKGQRMIYSSNFTDESGNRVTKTTRKGAFENGLTLKIPEVELLLLEDESITANLSDAYVRINPNFVADVNLKRLKLKYLRLGIDNGKFEYNYKLELAVEKAIAAEKERDLLKVSNNIVFMLGPVPVLISTSFAIKSFASISASATLSATMESNYQKNFSALVVGNKWSNIRFIQSSSQTSTSKHSFDLKGALSAELGIGPEISVTLYKVVGPYFNLPLMLSAEATMNQNLNWDARAALTLEGNVGCRVKIWKFLLLNKNYNLFTTDLANPLELPSKLEILSGNNQTSEVGSLLPYPIKLKVTANYGFGVPFVPIRLSLKEGNGSITKEVRYTDMQGIVEIDDWTLGSNPTNILDIEILNSDNDHIINSPSSLKAFSTIPPFDCSNTDLDISFVKSGSVKLAKGIGGKPPYTYSTDGINFNMPEPPQLPLDVTANHRIYVIDDNACTADRSINIVKPNPCIDNPVALDVLNELNLFQTIGIRGTAPYLFAVDDPTSFSSNYLFSNLTEGWHQFFIKDANGCEDSRNIQIIASEEKAISALNPKANSLLFPVEEAHFQWYAGAYTVNQLYDIFLKKEGEAYSPLLQNTFLDNFIFNDNLDYQTTYVWKIVVKDENGDVKDELESKFTTMASPEISMGVPTLVHPINGGSVYSSTELKWESQGGDYRYYLYMDQNSASTLVASGLVNNSVSFNSLMLNSSYNWRVAIKNPLTAETLNSEVWQFNVLPSTPTVSTESISYIGINEASCAGTVNVEGEFPVTARGICWDTNENPTIEGNFTSEGSGLGTFVSNLTGLSNNTTYYIRAYATNNAGTIYGEEISFITLDGTPTLPVLTTTEISDITTNSAISGGVITDDGGSKITERGVCWSTEPNPSLSDSKTIDGSGSGSFTSSISNLVQLTTYYLRAYAINSTGTSYGQEITFSTIGKTITDIQGNVYKTVVIGDQEWMAENLKTTLYSDGSPILTGLDNSQWQNTTSGAYAIYPHASIDGLNSEAEVLQAYGVLYNWYAVETDMLCPTGWRVPSILDWTALANYLGGKAVAGNKLKSTHTEPNAHPRWNLPNEGASDESNFMAYPGGARNYDGPFITIGTYGAWWSSDVFITTNNPNFSLLGYNRNDFSYSSNRRNQGFSVRCIKD